MFGSTTEIANGSAVSTKFSFDAEGISPEHFEYLSRCEIEGGLAMGDEDKQQIRENRGNNLSLLGNFSAVVRVSLRRI